MDLHLGRLALLRGELDAADRHLVAALSSSRSMHALAFVAQSHLELARLRRLQSREAEAAEHVSAALVLGRRLGLSPLIRQAETLTGAPDRPGPLSPRELEIAGLVAGGLSNRAIAERLVISERTVENHVSRILHKTGHTSRAGVAAWFVSR